jgi:hypothetical protein
VTARIADLSLNVALTNSVIASPDTIRERGNGKSDEITLEAVSGVGRLLRPDVGSVHGDTRSKIAPVLNPRSAKSNSAAREARCR